MFSFSASLTIQDPQNRFIVKKWIQNKIKNSLTRNKLIRIIIVNHHIIVIRPTGFKDFF